MINKRATALNLVIVHLVLIGIFFSLFLMANAEKVNQRGVKQQVIEKELALLIDSAVPGMSFEIKKLNYNGNIGQIELKNGRIFSTFEGFSSIKGYPYFSSYKVFVVNEEDKFVVRIDEK